MTFTFKKCNYCGNEIIENPDYNLCSDCIDEHPDLLVDADNYNFEIDEDFCQNEDNNLMSEDDFVSDNEEDFDEF